MGRKSPRQPGNRVRIHPEMGMFGRAGGQV